MRLSVLFVVVRQDFSNGIDTIMLGRIGIILSENAGPFSSWIE